jgi:hypothetical protein
MRFNPDDFMGAAAPGLEPERAGAGEQIEDAPAIQAASE